MESHWILLIISAVGGFIMAFSNGANDVANAFASAVGSKALTVKKALLIAAILTFVGAVFLGSKVASTLIGAVIKPSVFSNPDLYILGMLSCLLATGIFVLISTLTGMPVSSTHAIVGSMTGVGIVLGGFSTINWPLLTGIAISWVASPFLSGLISYIAIKLINHFVYRPGRKTILDRFMRFVPIFLSLAGSIIIISLVHKSRFKSYFTVSGWSLTLSILVLLSICYIGGHQLLKMWIKRTENSEKGSESLFKKLQVGTSSFVAFAHGSNDVANSISPMVAIFTVMQLGQIPTSYENIGIPLWILCLGGVGMATGTAVLGYKVMATLGEKITLITNSKGFCIDLSTATTVVIASVFGIPISTTHAATGSIVGIGFSQGKKALNLNLITKILIAWVFTVPVAALTTVACFWVLKYFLY